MILSGELFGTGDIPIKWCNQCERILKTVARVIKGREEIVKKWRKCATRESVPSVTLTRLESGIVLFFQFWFLELKISECIMCLLFHLMYRQKMKI